MNSSSKSLIMVSLPEHLQKLRERMEWVRGPIDGVFTSHQASPTSHQASPTISTSMDDAQQGGSSSGSGGSSSPATTTNLVAAYVTEVPSRMAQASLKVANAQSPLGPLLGHLKRCQRAAKRVSTLDAESGRKGDDDETGAAAAVAGKQEDDKKKKEEEENDEEERKLVILLGPTVGGPLEDPNNLAALCTALSVSLESVRQEFFPSVDIKYPIQPNLWEWCNKQWPCSIPKPRVQDADPHSGGGGANFIFPPASTTTSGNSSRASRKQPTGPPQDTRPQEGSTDSLLLEAAATTAAFHPSPPPLTEKFSSIQYWMEKVRLESEANHGVHVALVVDPKKHTITPAGQRVIGELVSTGRSQINPALHPPTMCPYPPPPTRTASGNTTATSGTGSANFLRWPQHATFSALRAVTAKGSRQTLAVLPPSYSSQGIPPGEDKHSSCSNAQPQLQTSSEYLCTEMEVFTNVEPCCMCSMALVHSRIQTLYFAQANPVHGGILGHHRGGNNNNNHEDTLPPPPPLPVTHRLVTTNHRFHAYLVPEDHGILEGGVRQ